MRILYDPAPRRTEEIFSSSARDEFFGRYTVTVVDQDDRDRIYAEHLPMSDVVVGQQPMGAERLRAAPDLRAIINVETNFLGNVDYDGCFARGIHVLTPASVFAVPVAELGLGMALSLARDIHGAHADFLHGREVYGLAGNGPSELLTGSDVGLVGFGDLGRALLRLLAPFGAQVRVYDPWLPDGFLRRQRVHPCPLEDVLRASRFVFVVAAVTEDSTHLLNRERFAMMPDGAMLILLSRAAVADFGALAEEARSGRIRVATDVFPDEPVQKDDPIRSTPGILFSAHRAGALRSALHAIGDLVLEDLSLIARGLPPVSCRRADRETVSMLQSKPIELS